MITDAIRKSIMSMQNHKLFVTQIYRDNQEEKLLKQ